MKKNINGILILISVLILCGFGYYIYNDYRSLDRNFNKIETSVNVTDEGISYGIDNVYNSVVAVQNFKNNKENGIGSGFIYSEDGYIMTNHHVIKDATNVKVLLMNGETVDCEIIGSDEYADIAVIKIKKEKVDKVAKLGDSKSVKLGDTVFTIGSPLGIEYFGTVTRGILSAKDRMVEVSVTSGSKDWIMNVMQTDAAINPGNSGGPLCNVNGDVIGINSMKIVQDEIEGIGFAIPIEDAMEYANMIVSGEKIKRSYLGISMGDIANSDYYLRKYGIEISDDITSGVIVIEPESNGPAYEAGILKGDVITNIGEFKVKNIAELRYYLYKYEPLEKIVVTVIRKDKEISLEIVLGESKN